MELIPNQSLKHHNTFGFDVKAKLYAAINTVEDLKEILKTSYADELFILGGGSNVLLSKDLDCTVLHINLKGITILNESASHVIIQAKAGENWHQFVRHCVENGYGGLENLSLIPGNVGTAPVQNIGAYGIELQDSFVECEAIHRQTLEVRTFKKEECHFGYRNSIFKNEAKDLYIITGVTFRLTKNNHQLHTSYGSIQEELQAMQIAHPSIKTISDAVIRIRQRKLPDPNQLGNSGSFFKNPIITEAEFKTLQVAHPEVKYYEVPGNQYKIPAGWLIDQVGFKGYREGDAGVHKNQALVLVNYGKATGEDILNLARKIQAKVKENYQINLETEVNIIA